MLDFSPIRNKETTWQKFVSDLTHPDLINLSNEMLDTILGLISECVDEDVIFQPNDPDADDPYAENPDDQDLAWNLGHVIVHLTASAEESAFLAAELARGVEIERRRSRYETNWETVNTIAQCRQRLEESRRIQLACLDIWPDEPHLDNTYEPRKGFIINPILRHVLGLSHTDTHLGQIQEIVRQSKAALKS